MHSAKALQLIVERIKAIYPVAEARNIAFIILESLFSLNKSQILANYTITEPTDQIIEKLELVIIRILNNEPIQYITRSAFFYNHNFLVNPAVLIPRPETEELVEKVISNYHNKSISILDIGTGSGCIAITLAISLPFSKVSALDVSELALETARKNAQNIGANVEFILDDILKENLELPSYDVIVSNPPYITLAEKNDMRENVVAYEPSLALFVQDHNPLLFYHQILKFCHGHLSQNGALYVEINEAFGREVQQLFMANGFKDVVVSKDLNQKDRIVSGFKN